MKLLVLALRNLARHKRRSATVAGAIAFCFAVSLAIGALAKGTASTALDYVAAILGGEVYVSLNHYEGSGDERQVVSLISDRDALTKVVLEAGMAPSQITFRSSAWAEAMVPNSSEASQGVSLEGIAEADMEGFVATLIPDASGGLGVPGPGQVLMSRSLAGTLGIAPGDGIQVSGWTQRGQRTVAEYTVAGLFVTQGTWENSQLYLTQAEVNHFLDIEPAEATRLLVRHLGHEAVPAAEAAIREALARHYVSNEENEVFLFNMTVMRNDLVVDDSVRQDFEGERFMLDTILGNSGGNVILSAANFMRLGGMVILALVMLVTVIGLNNNFRMIILERVKEIGTMRALGMQGAKVSRLFLAEGAVLLVLSLALGLGLGGLIILVVGAVEIPVPEFTRFLFLGNRIHFQLDMVFFALISGVIALTVLLSVWVPSRAAARVAPAEALRESH